MKKELEFFLIDILKNDSQFSKDELNKIQKEINFHFPSDYIELMIEYNGGEGGVGENSWLCLFPIEGLLEINADYRLLMERIPDYILFGKDAADTGYAFNKINSSIHSFGLMSDFKTDKIEFCGNTFTEFLKYLYNS